METRQHDDFIKALFARNSALYGSLRMEATEGTPPEEKDVSEAPDAPSEDASEGEGKPEDKGEDKAQDDLPEWARKELSNVRAEAAKYRTQLREAEKKLSEAKSPDEVATAIQELKEQNAKLERSLLVTKVAAKHSLSDLLADRLRGNTEEELEADAKLLAAMIPPKKTAPPESLGGGLDPSSDDDESETDPRTLAAKFRRF